MPRRVKCGGGDSLQTNDAIQQLINAIVERVKEYNALQPTVPITKTDVTAMLMTFEVIGIKMKDIDKTITTPNSTSPTEYCLGRHFFINIINDEQKHNETLRTLMIGVIDDYMRALRSIVPTSKSGGNPTQLPLPLPQPEKNTSSTALCGDAVKVAAEVFDNAAQKGLLGVILGAIGAIFSGGESKVDTYTSNAAKAFKLYAAHGGKKTIRTKYFKLIARHT